MAARRMRPRLILLIGLCLVAGLAVVPASPVVAEDEDMLGRPTSDVAFIPRGAGASPDLLTLSADGYSPAEASLALLRRNAAGWGVVNHVTFPIVKPFDQANIPWMVELGGDRFAVLASSQNAAETVIVPVTVQVRGADASFTVGESLTFVGNLAESGAADVDGDGTKELVVSRWIDGNDDGRCGDMALRVYHWDASEVRETPLDIDLEGAQAVRIDGATFGEFDGRPGTDLLANVYDTCATLGDGAERHHIVAIRLANGSIIADLPSTDADSPLITPTPPLAVDVDGDGRDEAVVRGPRGFKVIDLANQGGLEIGPPGVPPVAVRGGAAGTSPAIVTWVDRSSPPGARVWSTRIERIAGALVTVQTTSAPYPEPTEPIGAGPTWPLLNGSYGGPGVGATIDLDGDGCAELLLSAATADCLGTGAIRPAPAWLNSRPLGLVGTPEDSRLLVADGLEWYPYEEGPVPPVPSAAGPGGWRGGWVQPFFLAEVATPLDVQGAPVPAPVIDPLTDSKGWIDLDAPPATRLLLRVNPLNENDTADEGPRTLTDFMRRESTEYEAVLVRRLPGSDRGGTDQAMSRLPFAIQDEAQTGLGPGDRWSVSAVALDARGVPSAVTRTTVIHDTVAPTLTLDEAPFLSLPWPFEARVGGTSEPGATVRLGDGPTVVADASGAFEFKTQLAPWPQTLEAVAVDASGNRTPASISVMGGIDLRGFPWPAIAAVAILVAVLLSSLRGTRRVRSIPSVATTWDDGGGDLVIEEIDPGSKYRRG